MSSTASIMKMPSKSACRTTTRTRAYLAQADVKTLISGPLLGADEETMIGSCFLLEADSIDEVEAFNRADPFAAAGVWKTVSIHPFAKRVDNR